MKHKVRQAALFLLVMVVFAGGIYYAARDSLTPDPYRVFEKNVEATGLVDVVYVGPAGNPTALGVIIVVPDQSPFVTEFGAFNALLQQELAKIIKDEIAVSVVFANPGEPAPVAYEIAIFDAQAIKTGTSMLAAYEGGEPINYAIAEGYYPWLNK